MTKAQSLFKATRQCCCCTTETEPCGLDRSIMAISFTIYRRPIEGKRELEACPRIQICKRCFENLITEGYIFQAVESRKFLSAIRESLATRYSAMLERSGSR